MKKLLVLLLSFSHLFTATAQKKKSEKFFLLDENYKSAELAQAKFLVYSVKENDTCWQFETYTLAGPMESSEQYKDDKASVLHGRSVYFNTKGTRDSIANLKNGLPDGSFYYFNDTGKVYTEKQYTQGVLIKTIDRIKQDSIDVIEWKRKGDTSTAGEKESEFPGGKNSWWKYLNKNMVYPQRAQNLNKQGTVVLQFIIGKDGEVFDQEIVQSVEYSIDQEALRMINESPAWTPAFQRGKNVKSYKKQPITFKLE